MLQVSAAGERHDPGPAFKGQFDAVRTLHCSATTRRCLGSLWAESILCVSMDNNSRNTEQGKKTWGPCCKRSAAGERREPRHQNRKNKWGPCCKRSAAGERHGMPHDLMPVFRGVSDPATNKKPLLLSTFKSHWHAASIRTGGKLGNKNYSQLKIP